MWGKDESKKRCAPCCKWVDCKPQCCEPPCYKGKYKPGQLVDSDQSGVVLIARFGNQGGFDGYFVRSNNPDFGDRNLEWFLRESEIKPWTPLPYKVGDLVFDSHDSKYGKIIKIEPNGLRWTWVRYFDDTWDHYIKHGHPCLPEHLRLAPECKCFCATNTVNKPHSCAAVCPLLSCIPCFDPKCCVQLFDGKIVCVGHNQHFDQTYPIGMVVEINSGVITGFENASSFSMRYLRGFDRTYASFEDFCKVHSSGTWVEVK